MNIMVTEKEFNDLSDRYEKVLSDEFELCKIYRTSMYGYIAQRLTVLDLYSRKGEYRLSLEIKKVLQDLILLEYQDNTHRGRP